MNEEDEVITDENDPEGRRQKCAKLSSLEPMDTIFVKHVKEGGPAHLAGLHTGDRIVSVNDEPVTGKTYAQVIALIQASDSALKLLVVPRDEDILQMAYQNSAYNSPTSKTPSMLPRPVPFSPPNSADKNTYMSSSGRGQMNSAPKPYVASSYSSELEYETTPSYTSSVCIRSEPAAGAATGNKVSFMDTKRDFEMRAMQESSQQSVARTNSYSFGLYFPSPKVAAARTGSMDNMNSPGKRTEPVKHQRGSQDTVLRPIENSVRSSSEQTSMWTVGNAGDSQVWTMPSSASDRSAVFPRSRTTSGIVGKCTNPPYSTASESRPASLQASDSQLYQSQGCVAAKQGSNNQSYSALPPALTPRALSVSCSGDFPPSWTSHGASRRLSGQEDDSTGNARTTFMVRVGERRQSGHGAQVPQSVSWPTGTAFALTRSPMAGQTIEGHSKSTSRPIVSRRLKHFEELRPENQSNNANSSPNNGLNRYKSEIEKMTTFVKFESVASRAANFEHERSEGQPIAQAPEQPQPSPSFINQQQPPPSFNNQQQQLPPSFNNQQPPPSFNNQPQFITNQQPAVKVRKICTERYQPGEHHYMDAVPIRIYIPQNNTSAPSSPSLEIVPTFLKQEPPPYPCQDRSVKFGQTTYDLENVHDRHSFHEEEELDNNRPMRKPSYLTAVNAPVNRLSSADQATMEMDEPAMATCTSTPIKAPPTPTGPNVVLRKKSEAEEEAIKLQRRTSYLMATAKDRSNLSLPLDKSLSPPSMHVPMEHQQTTPTRNISIKKLKNLFGERTPRIMEAIEQHPAPAPSPLYETTREGWLCCKWAITDGKRSADRSWRNLWCVLKGHALYMLRDKKESFTNLSAPDEQPVSIKSCMVDIAYDYVKKKNVFRLTTYSESEYLFQADDIDTMMQWIQAIQSNNNPDEDEKRVASNDLILRKTSQLELNTKNSPQQPLKSGKKSSITSLTKVKIPSPSIRRRKTAGEKDDGKASRKWKDKLGLKRWGSSTQHPIEVEEECQGTFGVPLEACTASPDNEFVPLVVELCTKTVEGRGLEVIGVYRVPGNKAAVSLMQEEINRGIHQCGGNEKWQDVNVVSSLLKTFFRKLPQALVTNDLYQSFINANRIENPEKRMLRLKRYLHELPEHHFETFKHIGEHLQTVASFYHLNKMDARNLAIVFGPTLIRKSDDDMATLVSDMSDQCRIVESIILHTDWFFSSWDVDNFVPIDDDSECTPVTTMMSHLTQLVQDDQDADRNVSPKDLVSTIIQAANKKIKRKDKKSVGSDDVDTTDCTFAERNIDREIARRKLQQVPDSSLNDSQTQSESSSISAEHKASQDNLDSAVEARKKSAPFATFDEEFPDWEVIHTTTEVTRSGHLPRRPPLSRHYSDESLLEKSDELEISHGLNSSYSLSRDTLDRLRRIELEARALREREELRQREHEKRRIDKQWIEQELQRAQRDLEHEDSHSVEDLLNPKNGSLRIAEYPDKSPDMRSGSTSSASDSVFSPERNTLSGNRNSGGYMTAEQMPAGPISIRLETRSYGYRGETLPKMESTTSTRGGQYFLHSVNPRPGDRRAGGRPHGQYGIESLTAKGKMSGSLETIVDNKQSGGGSRSQPKKREIPQSSAAELKPKTGPFMRNGSMRKGSLDSLIDFYDKQENRMSWASTDSEDGSDLLTSLTTTFDQKLQILLNPKYKLTGSSRRLNKADASSDSSSTHSEAVEKPQATGAAAIPQASIVHKKGPESSLSFSNPNLVSDCIKEKPFRDPSLHRSQKSEAKIGIASRFERNPIKSASAVVSASESTSGATVNAISTARMRPSMVTFTIGLDKPVQSVEPNTSGVVTTVASVQDSSEHPVLMQSKVKMDIVRPISKSEKTEVNISLSKLDKDVHSFESKVYNAERGKLTVKSGHTKRNADTAKDPSGAKSRSASPPPTKRKHVDKCDKRRHTVGGTDDLDHFKALVSVTQQKDDVQISAWDQLQPAVKNRDGSENRSVLSWIQKERLRTSSPDLSQQTTKENATKKA